MPVFETVRLIFIIPAGTDEKTDKEYAYSDPGDTNEPIPDKRYCQR